MEEKVSFQKTLTLSEIMRVIKTRFVWLILIIVACVGVGVAYITFMQETSYTATSVVCVQAKNYTILDEETGLEKPANVAEHTKYQYSALLAPEFEKVLKSAEMVKKIRETGNDIVIGKVSFKFTENSAFFEISYSYSAFGGDDETIKAQVANDLNKYLEDAIEIINEDNSSYGFLKDKLIPISKASKEYVSVDTGRVKTVVLSLVIGLALCVVLVVVLYFTDDTVTSKDDVEFITGVSNLAFIDISTNEVVAKPNNNKNKGAK